MSEIIKSNLFENQQAYMGKNAPHNSIVFLGAEPAESSLETKQPQNKHKLSCRQPHQPFSDVEGVVLSSDQAYLDMTLQQGNRCSTRQVTLPFEWESLITVKTCSRKMINKKSRQVCYAVMHMVFYNGEPIWKIETECKYGMGGTSGQSASCTLMQSRGTIRLKILHKGKTCLGQGRNSREIRNYDLITMIIASGEALRRELSCVE